VLTRHRPNGNRVERRTPTRACSLTTSPGAGEAVGVHPPAASQYSTWNSSMREARTVAPKVAGQPGPVPPTSSRRNVGGVLDPSCRKRTW